MERPNVKSDHDLKDLEGKIGIALPCEVVLLDSTDGGGRDPSYGFYAWTMFSASPITMPPRRATKGKEYLVLPLADSVRFVEAKLRNHKISEPQTALSSEWEDTNYTFDGTLIRSREGDYLVVERFRKK